MRISIKGIVVGGVADVVLSGLIGIPLSIYIISSHGLSQVPKEQLGAAVIGVIHGSVGLRALQLLIGCLCSVLGGYIAARLSAEDQMLNGVLASWLCIGIGIYSLVGGKVSEPVMLQLALIAVTPVCYWLGAKLRVGSPRGQLANA